MKKLFFFTLVFLFSLACIAVNAQDRKQDNKNQKNPAYIEQNDISKLPPKIPVNSIRSQYINESQTDVVSGIAFTQTAGTYTAIAGTTIIAAGTDDGSSTIQNIGFNFVYNGTVFTTYGANSNGYITLGAVPGTSYSALSSIPNTIAFCNRDGRTNGAVTYLLSGSAPNRVLTIQYPNWYQSYSYTTDQLSAQIKLYETTNVIEIVYGGTTSITYSYTPYVGINGSVTTDFSVRTTTTSWAATTAGATNTATMTWSPTAYPATGQIYRWSPGVEIGTYPWKEYFNVWPPSNFNLTGGTQNWAQYISSTDSAAYCNFWNWTAGYYALMQTPLLNLTPSTGLTAPTLAFRWSHQYMSSYPNDSLGVYITTNSGTNWIAIWGLKGAAFNSGDGAGTTTPGSYVTANVDLTPYLNQRASIRFVGYSGYGPDVFISDVSVFNGGPPSVTTTTPTNITNITATSGGNVTLQGASPVTARGVCWSTTANPTTANSKTIDGSGTGVFTSSITGLTANTVYHVRAYATNTQGTSYGSDILFTSSVDPIAPPVTENFDGVTAPNLPAGWTVEDANADSYKWTNVSGYANSGSNSMGYTSYVGNVMNDWFFSRPLTLTSGVTYAVTFNYRSYYGYTHQLEVKYGTTQSSAGMTSAAIFTNTSITNAAYTQGTGTLTAPTTGTYYIGFHGYSTSYSYYLFVDDFSITQTISNPVSFSAVAFSPSQINLTFAPNASSNNVVIVWNNTGIFTTPSGAPPSAGSAFAGGTLLYNGISSPQSHTGLTQGTQYYYKAFSYNGSIYSPGLTANATTPCISISSFPWNEGFEGLSTVGANILPPCWSYTNITSNNYSCNSTCNSNTAHTGTKFIGGSWSFDVWNFTPGFQLTGGTSYDFSYWFKCTDAVVGYNVTIAYGSSPAVGSMSNTLSAETGLNIYTWTSRKFSFTPATTGTYYFGVHNASPTSAPNGIAFDDFCLDLTPSTPIFSIIPASKAYGSVTVGGGSADQIFTFTNTGGGTLSINNGGISISGADASQFLLLDNNSYPINLASNQSASVRAVFTPIGTGSKSANLHIDDNTGGHDIAITGTGTLNAPQSLLGGLNASFLPSLSWQSPSPGAEIKIDDGTAEQNMWVGSPSTTSQMFYDKFVSPHNGTISQIAVYASAGSAGLMFNSIMLCPDDGTGKPNIAAPWASFNNVAVSTTYSWIFSTLLAPQNVTAGQTFYIVTQWPAGSTTGPYIGTDNTSPAGRSSWTQDGGTTWNAWGGNFFMRAYMGTYSDKLISGIPDPRTKMLPVKTTLLTNPKNVKIEKKEKEYVVSVPAATISGGKNEKILSSYTLQRGSSSGSYDTQFPGLNSTTFDDVSASMGNTYYYAVQANYTDGTSGYSNEVFVTALNPNYGTFATNLYKFSNSTANGNPAPNQKPSFEWIPTTDFTPIAVFTGNDDDGYFQINFPGQFFKFFGTDYSSVYIGTNGYITFGAGNTAYSPVLLPSAGAPFNMIAGAFKDLYVQRTYTPATNISYKINPDNVIISYENIYDISGADGTNYISFQIILYTNTFSPTFNSLFIINYNDDMSAAPLSTNMIVAGASVGVNNGTGTAGYNYRFTGTKGPLFNGVGKSIGAMALGMVDNNAGTLPVKLSSFTNSVSGRDVNLNWTTESENNNAGFEIYRKNLNDASWSKISFVSGKGNNTGKSSYVFSDRKLNSGKYEYKLKQIDNNGNYVYYTLGVYVEIGVPAKYNLSQNYPNPFNPVSKIDYDLPFDSKVRLIVFDILGREVKNIVNGDLTKAGYYTVEFNATGISSGAYFYRIIANGVNGKDYIATKKMVIVK